jgi:hypothetical protein
MKAIIFAVAIAALGTGCKSKGSGGGNALAKMTELKDEMCKCKDAKCAQDVSSKMTAWTQEQAKSGAAKMSEADTAKAQSIGEELGKCMASAMTANGSAGDNANGSANNGNADGSAAASAAGGSAAGGSAAGGSAAGGSADPAAFADLPQDCLDYRAAVDRLSKCGDKLPADVRQLLKDRFDESVAGWAKLPAEAKKSLGDACKAGVSAVESAAKDKCGWQ